jgi:predicted ATPase/class 3 adenylate cyclase
MLKSHLDMAHRENTDTPPSGTVTFLFTDIEGSTRLWEGQPELMSAALARHDRLLREAIEAHAGHVFNKGGDAFCAAFASAADALASAVSAQLALASDEGELGGLRVRMALHSGAVEERGGDYFGPALNRVARLLAVGHGGQVLLSRTAYELVCDSLPNGSGMRACGAHRLKDLERPEEIFQLLHPRLRADFPPLRSLDAHPTNLPAQPTPLVGRDRELAALREVIGRPDVRLLALVGPGGIGKTRLGLQLASDVLERFRDGVFFVALADLTDPELIPSAVARALGLRESVGQSLVGTLREHLRDRELLLLLDNFEQLAPGATFVSDLLAAAPGAKALVTSRSPLHIRGERQFPVPPLGLPAPGDLPPPQMLQQYEGVRLFVERATQVKPDFSLDDESGAAVAEICLRLDGLPLAIELAAARVKLLGPNALLDRLERSTGVLGQGARDAPARQRTLEDTIAWSYDLLESDEPRLFRALSAFRGGCTLEAAEAVGEGEVLDGLASLVDKSLLRRADEQGDEPRFAMLETIRQYARERLAESGEDGAVLRRHAEHYRAFATAAEPELRGPDQVRWFRRVELESDNIRSALGWALERREVGLGLEVGGAIWRLWEARGPLTEGRRWLDAFLSVPTPSELAAVRAKALNAAGVLASDQGDYRRQTELQEESLALSRDLGDKVGIASCLNNLAVAASWMGKHERATRLLMECQAIRRELGDRVGLSDTLTNLGGIALEDRDYKRAVELYEESLAITRELGDPHRVGVALSNLGSVACYQGDHERAAALLEESLALARSVGDRPRIARALASRGWVAYHQGELGRATEGLHESMVLCRELGERRLMGECLKTLAGIAAARGEPLRAARLAGAVEVLREALGVPLSESEKVEHEAMLAEARVGVEAGDWERAWHEGRGMGLEEAVEYGLASGNP